MRRTGRRVAAGALALAALVGAAPVARADVRAALEDYKAGRYLESAAELQAIVDRSPGYAYGYFLLGHCMLKMKRPKEAEREFRRAVSLDPAHPEYYQGLALALKSQADWSRAVRVTSEGLTRVRDSEQRFSLLALRGYAWGALERWPEAARDLEAARAIHAEPSICLLLGKAFVSMGMFAAAIPPLRQALGVTPDDPAVLRLLAESLVHVATDESDPKRKRAFYVEAQGYARRLAAARPDDPDAVHLVARAAMGAGQLEQAVGLFLHVLALDPRQCYAMVNLGRTYMGLHRYADAERFLQQAAACAPRLPAVFETLGDLYLSQGLPQRAAEMFRRANEIEPPPRNPRGGPARAIPPTVPVSGP